MTRLSLAEAAAYQLLPGVLSLVAFTLMASVLASWELPNIIALAGTILLVEVPVCWAIMIWRVKRESGGVFRFRAAFPWMASVPWWQYALIGIPMIVFSMVIMFGVGAAVEVPLRAGFFNWVPDWFVLKADPDLFTSYSREVLLLIWVLNGVAMVLIGGATQELYSRGFLLPRTAQMGLVAPAYNALLFAVFHMVAPWSWLPFFLMVLPWSYLVWWKRSVKIGLFIHVGMLTLQWIGMTLMVFGLVSLPGS